MLKQVEKGVFVHQSEFVQTNATVVQGQTGVLLIDPGITESEMACLADDLRKLGRPVVAGFSTHPDWDHVLWHSEFGEAPRYGTTYCAAFMQDLRSSTNWKDRAAKELPPELASEIPLDLYGLITSLPAGATHIPWDGPKVRILEHRAHFQGHAALLIEERRVLVAGDMLSDVLPPILDWSAADPIKDYLDALSLLESAADDADVIIPGHGSVGGNDQLRARIKQDRAYVQALRDNQTISDPRIVPSDKKDQELAIEIHAGQLKQLAEKRVRDGMDS